MLTDKNFANALLKMNFIAQGNVYIKIFAENIIMKADLHLKRLAEIFFCPEQKFLLKSARKEVSTCSQIKISPTHCLK